VLLGNDAETRALRAAERTYDHGDRAGARRAFAALLARDPDSLQAAVGAAVAAWPRGAVAKLRALADENPDSALVRLHLGLALYAGGDDAGAAAQWREGERRDPDTPAALRAEDLLHPEMVPGRPFFIPSFGFPPKVERLPPQEQVDALRRRADNGRVRAKLLYGVALQHLGRPLSARAEFAAALALDPGSLAAQVADAVGRFDKDDPSAAFSRLGPLTRAHGDSPLVRFHLGLLLLWIREIDEAQAQLQRAVAADPRGFYGREAKKLLSRLEAVGT
jgi:predicted Zn-dependent protease